MSRSVSVERLQAALELEFERLPLRVTKNGRPVAVVIGARDYTRLVNRIQYLEDSVAASVARSEPAEAVPWDGCRRS